MTLTFGREIDNVLLTRHVKYLGQMPYGEKVIVSTHTRTHGSDCSTWTTNVVGKCTCRFSLSNGELRQLLQYLPNILQTDSSKTSQFLECPYPSHETCSKYDRYRTYDGRCNNLWMPLWGSSHQPLARFLPPDYADGKTPQNALPMSE